MQIQSQQFLKRSRAPDPALLGTIIAHPLASTCDVATICEIRSVSNPNICRRSQNLKIWPLDLTTPVCGYFVMCEIGLAKIYSCTKFDVSSFTNYRFMEEDLKFKIWAPDPDHAPFAGILSRMRWDLPRSIHIYQI